MSGHSKWANIRRKKEKTDAKKGKIFTKIGREIMVAVREGGANPNENNKLRDVIAKAKAANMPNDNIDRSIKKAAGAGEGINFEEVTYEGYGPNGVAFVVEALTDNRNRTASDVRHAFDKNGGSLGATGCVLWMFDRKGLITIEQQDDMDEDSMMMASLEAGAEDMQLNDGIFEITTDVSNFSEVCASLESQNYHLEDAEISFVPQNTVTVPEDDVSKIERILDMLEDNDDIQNVYHNAEMTE